MSDETKNPLAALTLIPGGREQYLESKIRRIGELQAEHGNSADIELLELLEHPHIEVRRQAVAALCSRGGQLALIGCRSCVNDAEWVVRNAAIEALGEIGCEADIRVMMRATADDQWVVRASAASSLSGLSQRYDTSCATPLMIRLLESDPSSDVRRYVAVALGDMLGAQAAPALEMRASQETDPRSLSGLYGTLYRLGDPFQLIALLTLLDSHETEVMCQVFAALDDVKSEDVGKVIEYIEDRHNLGGDDGLSSTAAALLVRLRSVKPTNTARSPSHQEG